MLDERTLRCELAAVARRLYERGLVAASDGNVSARLPGGDILISASGTHLGELRPRDMVRMAADGRPLEPGARPSSESPLHRAAYAARPDVQAIVHAHPPTATAFSYAGLSLGECVIPEVVLTLGRIATAPYATPGSPEGANAIKEVIADHDAIVLERHGVVTVGRSPWEAYYKLEKVEHAAHVLLTARQLGNVISLSSDELQRLAALREKLGLGSAADVLRRCGGKPS